MRESKQERELDENIATERAANGVDADLARRIRAEVKHIDGRQSEEGGESDGNYESDGRYVSSGSDGGDDGYRREQSDEQGEDGEQGGKQKTKFNVWEALMSGRILLHRNVARYYSHMMLIAVMTFVSIFVMFWSLRVDMRHNELNHRVQLLRERSIRMRESSYASSSHSAIVRELERRGINLRDARTPSMVIED